MARNDGPISASYLNPLIEEHRKWTIEIREWLLSEFYASGHPPGTEPSTPYEIYARLISLMQAGHPDYWQNPAAQEDLRKLETEFGPAPPVTPQSQATQPPMGVM